MEKKRFNINLDDTAFTKERSLVTSLFKAKDGQAETSSAQNALPAPGQPLSYADFVVQNKNRALQGAAHVPEKQSRSDAAAQSNVNTADSGSVSTSSTDSGKPETEQRRPEKVPTEDQTKEESQSSESCIIPPHLLGSGNSIIVSPRQRGNPILKFVRNVPWEFGEVVPDYVLGRTTCALFLSVRYHNLNPNYIHERLKQLGQSFTLRVLLVQVDVKDPHHALKELARISIMADCTLILAWSPEEAGRYLETYKSYEKKPADVLKEQVEKNYLSQVTDCLTTVKSVNKTDAMTLLSTFSSLEGIVKASKEELVLCPGLGPQKARRLYDVLHQPFIKTKKKES
ncbi:DNA excision repair protein ERCC-1 [Puntigrus tetrazona]|uniref:DNA excision repair protein ERCC-1 n=1 Tax=Puntigrus tetrazona TaxID=1606681 RepID=UPI001C8AA3A8|nr:DNA excision repair protein ERCC-1 [Puntigrus tetrazona]